MTPDQISERLEQLKQGLNPSAVVGAEMLRREGEYRFFAPLSDAADEYVRFAKNPHERIYLGIQEFDDAMRGVAPGELCLILGFAHSGKTVLVSEMIVNNADELVALFTPDETRVLVLVKLASLVHGISAEELEERISHGDEDAEELIRSTARKWFPNLVVFDTSMDVQQMAMALDEAERHWGAKCQAVIFDYAELLQGVDDAKGQIKALKAFGKKRHVPLFLLHQSSRTAGKDGAVVTLSSGAFGGEQEATFVIGVRRKKNELSAQAADLRERIRTSVKDSDSLQLKLQDVEYELMRHQNTVTFNLVKNKRPPSRLVEDTDFKLDRLTGRIERLDGRFDSRIAVLTEVARQRRESAWEQQELVGA